MNIINNKKTMTAKEKAKQLTINFDEDSWHDETGFKGGSAERCALIATNEVLKQLYSLHCNSNISDGIEIMIKEQIDFWADVNGELY